MSNQRFLPVGMALLMACVWPVVAELQQPAADMPGAKWNEEQIRAAAPIRVGRKLTPKAWPNGARVAVCLTFDVDAEASGAAPADILPVPLSAREFGTEKGLPRILDLLDRHNVPATFYFAAMNATLNPQSVDQIQKRGRHEIGLKGWANENLGALNNEAEEQRLLDQSIAALTKVIGKRPVGWRAPSRTFSRYTLSQIIKAGFLYDNTMAGRDEPYEIIANGQPTGFVELPANPILNDEPYFTRGGSLPSPELIFKAQRDEFDVAYSEGTMLMVMLHPHISGHRSRIVHLENLITYMKSKQGVWFATAEQIANHVKASVKTQTADAR